MQEQRFGPYLPLSCIGKGGFAVVYLCKHIHLGTRAAVKVLLSNLGSEYHEQFCREALMLQGLDHLHIVHIKDFGLEKGSPYLVMEYASNGSLRERYSKGTFLTPLTALSYLKQVADALQYAHEQHLVHRDIKPENMLIGQRGELLLSDFGIALMMQNIDPQIPRNIIGTPAYIAPEQLRGLPESASDQYALGVVVYEWLCGEPPFQGSPLEIAMKHVNMPPPSLCQKNPNISPEVEKVVLKALAKEPNQRYPSVASFAKAFEMACLPPKSPVVITFSKKQLNALRLGSKRITRRQTLIGGGLAIGGGLVAFLVDRLIFPPIPYLVFTYTKHSDTVNMVVWSPGGNSIASASNDHTVRVWDAHTGSDIVPPYSISTTKMNSVAWSPDERYIVVGSDDAVVRVWQVNSEKLEYTIYHGHRGGVHSVAWSHTSSNQVVSAAGSVPGASNVNMIDGTVQIWEALTGNWQLTFPSPAPPAQVLIVAWSPDDKYIVSASRAVGNGNQLVHVWDVTQGKLHLTYSGHDKDVWGVAWSPDGTRIASASKDQTVQVWEAMTGTLISTYKGHTAGVRSVAWSHDDKYIVSASLDRTVQIWGAEKGGQHPLRTFKGHRNTILAVTWSPDGTRIASAGSDHMVMVWDATSL